MREMALESGCCDDIAHPIVPEESVVANKSAAIIMPNHVVASSSNTRVKRYKAFFKHLTDQEKAEFKSQRCVVPISLGQRYHEGKKLEALLKLVDKSFASCTIVVGDLLQRYSFEIEDPNQTEDKRIELALHAGKEWMCKNDAYINQLSIPHNMTGWQEWITQPTFQKYKAIVDDLYINDQEYKKLCDSIINQFLSRSESRRNNKPSSFNVCLKYLLEENAVFCLWAKAGHDAEVYPASKKDLVSTLILYTSSKIDVMKNYKLPIVAIKRK